MLAAQLHGKLTRKEEDLEDLLTSNVFGSMQYIAPEDGLILLLSSAEIFDCSFPLKGLQISEAPKYEFWQWLQGHKCIGCEPDLLIHLKQDNDKKIIILVEAKYKSGKSSEADESEFLMDQLAREWCNLICFAKYSNAIPFLLYITADFSYPKKEIEDAQKEILRKGYNEMNICWISWRKLPKILPTQKHLILKDLVQVLQRQGLTFFEGILIPEDIGSIEWTFQTGLNLNWSLYIIFDIKWKFISLMDNIKIFNINWRFSDE